ncbi:MAG: hypothetical protein J5615_01745 [Fibrobacter sp.]|nr:hypothetical protein [Fibrobacter sp.]
MRKKEILSFTAAMALLALVGCSADSSMSVDESVKTDVHALPDGDSEEDSGNGNSSTPATNSSTGGKISCEWTMDLSGLSESMSSKTCYEVDVAYADSVMRYCNADAGFGETVSTGTGCSAGATKVCNTTLGGAAVKVHFYGSIYQTSTCDELVMGDD